MTVVTYLFALIMALASQNVFAQKTFDFDDCIINGMKGVGSDAAAKLVKEACERKQRDQPDAKVDVYKKQLGRVMSEDTIELVEPPNSLDANFRAISIRNADADLTITFIRLKVHSFTCWRPRLRLPTIVIPDVSCDRPTSGTGQAPLPRTAG